MIITLYYLNVHEELKSSVTESDIREFNQSLDVYRNFGGEHPKLIKSVFDTKQVLTENFVENLVFNKIETNNQHLEPIYQNLALKSGGDNVWKLSNSCLFEDTNRFKLEAVTRFAEGFSLENVTLYGRFQEAVIVLADFVSDVWNSTDFTHILNFCNVNEKFVFILLYPYLIKPLGEIVWTTLLPHLHFVKGGFTTFILKVSNTLNRGTAFTHKYQTLSVKRSTKLVLGFSSMGLITLFSKFFTANAKQGLVSNGKLYKGLSGSLGSSMKLLRHEGSKVIYEVFKTLSTFSNAAIAGALDPKQEAISKVLETPAVSDMIKNIKK